MRNIVFFLFRFHAFILFVLLEVAALVLMVQNNRYHQAGFFNSSNYLSGVSYEKYSNVVGYFNLRDENRRLAEENAWLRSQLPSAYYNKTFQKVEVTDTVHKQVYSYIPADVVNITTNRFNNYITINKGLSQGIKPRMAVISPDGIVGIVKDASEHFAVIIPLLHKDLRVSGRVGTEGFIGTVLWNGEDHRYAKLQEIPKQVVLKSGDRVFTAGTRFFPEGLTIGHVTKADKNTPDNFYDITLKLSTPFAQLRQVYIINYLLAEEQTLLEDRVVK